MKNRITVGVITFLVLALLVFSGPLNAFNLDLKSNKDDVTKGGSIKFTATLEINSNEILDIENFILEIDGPTDERCKFSLEGEKIGSCDGIKIRLLSNTARYVQNYGYGYGYGYGYSYGDFGVIEQGYTEGKLIYEITLDSEDYDVGDYETEFFMNFDGDTKKINGPDFEVEKDDELNPPIPASPYVTNSEGIPRGTIYLSESASLESEKNSSPYFLNFFPSNFGSFQTVLVLIFMNLILIELIFIVKI